MNPYTFASDRKREFNAIKEPWRVVEYRRTLLCYAQMINSSPADVFGGGGIFWEIKLIG